MVKGTNRRVIVVRSPDPQLFEEAIFVLRDSAAAPEDAGHILAEAQRAAGEYLKKCGATGTKRRRARPFILILLAVLRAAGAWFGARYFLF